MTRRSSHQVNCLRVHYAERTCDVACVAHDCSETSADVPDPASLKRA